MMVKDNKYYFAGKESDYYIPDISRKCVKSSMWNSYKLDNGAKLKVHLIRAKTRKIKEADGHKVFAIKDRLYGCLDLRKIIFKQEFLLLLFSLSKYIIVVILKRL